MSPAAETNRPSTAPTSTSRPNPRDGAGEKAGKKLSEGDYLAQQAEQAQAALAQVVKNLKGHLGEAADPRLWTRQHPWIALGAAMAAGFTAGVTAVPSKEEQALKKLAEFERLTHGPHDAVKPEPAGDGRGKAAAKPAGVLQSILHELMSIAKPAIASAITASITAKHVDEAENAASKGQPVGGATGSTDSADAAGIPSPS